MRKLFLLLNLFVVWGLYAETFELKLPIKSIVNIELQQGYWRIDCAFAPTRNFPRQLSKKVDRKHAEWICHAALKKVYKLDAGQITFSGLQVRQAPQYESGKVEFFFKVPQAAIKVIKNPGKTSPKTVAVNSSSCAVVVPQGYKTKSEANKTAENITRTEAFESIIDDSLIENLALNGYPIRIKNDFLQVFCIFRNDFENISKEIELDNINQKHQLLQKTKKVKYRDVISNDNKIVESDAETICEEIGKVQARLIKEIEANLLNEIPVLEKELRQFRKEQYTALEKETSATEKDEMTQTISVIDKTLETLGNIKTEVKHNDNVE